MADHPRTAEEAEAQGWTVDRTCYPWVAYQGPPFMTTRWCQIETPTYRPEVDPDPSFSFRREHDGSLSIESAVYQALGFASTCWQEGTNGVFQEDQASAAARALLELIRGAEHELTDHLYTAWTIIANVSGGRWEDQSDEWMAAATRWRDQWHAMMDRHPKPAETPAEAAAAVDTSLEQQMEAVLRRHQVPLYLPGSDRGDLASDLAEAAMSHAWKGGPAPR